MANHPSALKRARQTKTRTERNRRRKNEIKKLRKATTSAIQSGDSDAASKAHSRFSAAVDKAATKGMIHKNKAANLKSRSAKALATLS